ncbi:MAG: DUF4124 domain-containing protein [Nitrospira sp.]|nr:DUF4124 domain-containing protein [Candidatus Manganitrophaceae bacterium]HIL33940.1 DUF4124 domain-containing protein [Candidatus Manganitrophaceae bacterium]
MGLSLRFGLVAVQLITIFMLTSGLADSTVYTWKDEAGVTTFSDNPNSAPDGVQTRVFIAQSSRQEPSETRVMEEGPGQNSGIPTTLVSQGEFSVLLVRELGYSGGQTPEAAARILSNIPIIPPFGGWDLDAPMTPEITSRLRATTIMAPQKGWISVTPEQALHAFDSAAALVGIPIPVDRNAEVQEALPPDQGIAYVNVVTQGKFAVHLSRELGLGKDLTDEEATRILSDLRVAPPLGKWEHSAAMTPVLTSRLRTLAVAASQMGWIAVTPEEALFAFDSAAVLSGVSIPVELDAEAMTASPRTVVVPPLVYLSPPPYIIAPYYTWVPVSGGFLWHGTTMRGFFALHSIHINIHFFNGHRFAFRPRSIRHHFLDHLRRRHLKNRHVIRRPVDRTAGLFTTPFVRPFPSLRHRQGGFRDREHIIRHRMSGRRPIESHLVNKHIMRRSTNYLLGRIPPYTEARPHIRNHQRGSRNSLHLRKPHRGGSHNRKDILHNRTANGKHRVRHLPPPAQHLATKRTAPSAPHALSRSPRNTRPSTFTKRQGKRGRNGNTSGRHRRR